MKIYFALLKINFATRDIDPRRVDITRLGSHAVVGTLEKLSIHVSIKSHYSFDDRGTDRRNRFQNVATLKDLSNDIAMTSLVKLKISQR